MPKRKRESRHFGPPIEDTPEAKLQAIRDAVGKKLFHGKVVLGRALKNARTLLGLKLQRNAKDAIDNGKERAKGKKAVDVERLRREIEALKVCLCFSVILFFFWPWPGANVRY